MFKRLLILRAVFVLSAPLLTASLILGSVASDLVSSPAVAADLASAKAVVDAAKAKGLVGEQADGYLGFVTETVDAATKAAVEDINAGRAAVYRDTAAKTGVSLEAAGEATAKLLIDRLPAGQFYKPVGGTWIKKPG